MKKLPLLLVLAFAVLACRHEEKEIDYRALRHAQLKMDIVAGKTSETKNGVGIAGDSAAVHFLTRYAANMMGSTNKFVMAIDTVSGPVDWGLRDWSGLGDFSRDTVRHVFSFSNSSVVWYEIKVWYENEEWHEKVDPNSYRLGALVCREDLVICSMIDRYTGEVMDRLNDVNDTIIPYIHGSGYEDRYRYDTLGYIPNSQMLANRAHLQNLLDEKKYQEMLDYFKTAYTIYTCTGEEYRELVRLGIN